MSALPAGITEQDARNTVARLAAIEPGNHWVVSCYLKLEPRDRTRGKYLIKMKNRVKALSQEHGETADSLRQVLDFLEESSHLPRSRAIAIFASRELGLFEVLPLPQPDDIPQDEREEDFVAALEHAKVSDLEYLTKIEALESQGRDDEIELARWPVPGKGALLDHDVGVGGCALCSRLHGGRGDVAVQQALAARR